MFTGLIRETGIIAALNSDDETATIQITAPETAADAEIGDSICVNGTCLTVSALTTSGFTADLSAETLNRTSFAEAYPGSLVNLEPSLRLSDKLGGHLVLGHVDGTGTIERIEGTKDFCYLTFNFPSRLAPYIAEKGSVCLEGISLTITEVQDCQASVSVIPTTLNDTNLRSKNPGSLINIEVDVIARYLERLISCQSGQNTDSLTIEKLRAYGYPIG